MQVNFGLWGTSCQKRSVLVSMFESDESERKGQGKPRERGKLSNSKWKKTSYRPCSEPQMWRRGGLESRAVITRHQNGWTFIQSTKRNGRVEGRGRAPHSQYTVTMKSVLGPSLWLTSTPNEITGELFFVTTNLLPLCGGGVGQDL